MALIYGAFIKYKGYDLDMWELAEICGKWLKYL